MFTGIIESQGIILELKDHRIKIKCNFLDKVYLGQSICHNGVCLTVTEINKDGYWVDIGEETLNKTIFRNVFSLATWKMIKQSFYN